MIFSIFTLSFLPLLLSSSIYLSLFLVLPFLILLPFLFFIFPQLFLSLNTHLAIHLSPFLPIFLYNYLLPIYIFLLLLLRPSSFSLTCIMWKYFRSTNISMLFINISLPVKAHWWRTANWLKSIGCDLRYRNRFRLWKDAYHWHSLKVLICLYYLTGISGHVAVWILTSITWRQIVALMFLVLYKGGK